MRRTGFLLVIFLFAMPSFGGVVFEVETKLVKQEEEQAAKLFAQDGLIKIGTGSDTKGGRNGFMVFHRDRREMVVVDHENASYSVIDEEAMRTLAGQMSSAMSQIAEALKNVPEDKRAMVEQMMKQKMPMQQPKVKPTEMKNTGERATRNGYPCVKYIVLQDGRKLRELWVTDWKNIDGSQEIVETFEEMAGFVKELLDSIPMLGDVQRLGNPSWGHMKELDGFPVVTRSFALDGTLESETTLRSAKRQTIDPATFEPPSGYKRQEMFPGSSG